MFSCPYCEYTLTGSFSKIKDKDSCEIIIDCKNCKAILRILMTTLKDPDPKRLEKNVNKLVIEREQKKKNSQEILNE